MKALAQKYKFLKKYSDMYNILHTGVFTYRRVRGNNVSPNDGCPNNVSPKNQKLWFP
jgi:hypothetical protein